MHTSYTKIIFANTFFNHIALKITNLLIELLFAPLGNTFVLATGTDIPNKIAKQY